VLKLGPGQPLVPIRLERGLGLLERRGSAVLLHDAPPRMHAVDRQNQRVSRLLEPVLS
jgi:hypothetical protein